MLNEQWLTENINNHTNQELANMIGCSTASIKRACRKFNVRRDHNGITVNNIDPQWLLERIESHTNIELSKMLGCSPSVVRTAMLKHSIYRSNFKQRSMDDIDEQWLKDNVNNHTNQELANLARCSISKIKDSIKKFGIVRNKGEPYLDKDWLHHQRIVLQKTCKTIANDCDCSRATIENWCKNHRIEIDQRLVNDDIVAFMDENIDTIREEILTTPLRKIASKYGVSVSWLKGYQKKHGISKLPVRENIIDITKEFLEEQRLAGKSYSTIAKMTGYTQRSVVLWCIKHDVNIQVFNPITAPQQEIGDYIESLGFNVIHNDKKVINGRELDIVIPEKNLAIEFNGLFWHKFNPDGKTESQRKDHTYHVKKTDLCEKNGFQLLQIFSDEWSDSPSIIKSMIAAKLGKNEKIFARKCSIVQITYAEKTYFLEKNHIQGKDSSSIYYGLKHESELVAVMTFGKPRYNKNYDWELIRFATKKGISVMGGFSKLLKHFRKTNDGTIISYADRRYSIGNVYEKNGFVLLNKSKPSYWYLKNGSVRLHRSNYTKKKLSKSINIQKTELELSMEQGLYRIYDCGTLVYCLP